LKLSCAPFSKPDGGTRAAALPATPRRRYQVLAHARAAGLLHMQRAWAAADAPLFVPSPAWRDTRCVTGACAAGGTRLLSIRPPRADACGAFVCARAATIWLGAPLHPGGQALLVAALAAELRLAARPDAPLDARTLTRLRGAAGREAEHDPLAALQARRRCRVRETHVSASGSSAHAAAPRT
jgi:hypothetical protein